MASSSEKLGNLLQSRMKDVSNYTYGSTSLILGRITKGMGLKMDDVMYTVPAGDYMICRSAALNSSQLVTETAEQHTHDLNIPTLSVGDRVLVARAGSEPVVIDVVIAG